MSRHATAFRTAAVLALLGVQGVFGGETYMSIVPVGTGPGGELAAGVVIDGSTITLTTDGINAVPVFLEIRIGDWDPADTGVTLAGYMPRFDSSSLTSGASGALTFNVGSSSCSECSDTGEPCFFAEECTPGTCSDYSGPCHPLHFDGAVDYCPPGELCLEAASCDPIASVDRECSDNGVSCSDAQDCTPGACSETGVPCHGTELEPVCPSGEFCLGAATCDAVAGGNDICEAEFGTGALCGPLGYFLGSGTCGFAYTDASRPDFVLADASAILPALDISSPDVRPAYAVVFGYVNDPVPYPAEGLYAATLTLLVPPDAQGTFTISLKPFPGSSLSSGTLDPIVPLEVIPAQIRVNPGRCCFNLQLTPFDRDQCVEGLTENECADQSGVTFFEAGGTCADPCPNVCGDNLNNQFFEQCDGNDDSACPGLCMDNCQCVTCGDDADMLGVAIFMNCFTGPGGGPVSPECHCAEYDSDDDVDLDDLFGFYDILNGP